MPLYDMQCKRCQKVVEVFCKIEDRKDQVCQICGELLQTLISSPNFIPFHEGFYEHIDIDPIYIKSKKQLQQECRRRGLTSLYVEGGKFQEI